MIIKSKKMTALLVALALIFSTTTGYAYGTARTGEEKTKVERKRPEKPAPVKVEKTALNLPDTYPDGEFFGSAVGYSGEIKVRVVVKEGKIVELAVVSQTETPGYYENGLRVIDSVLAKGSLNVDTISGATITSNAILQAAASALGASVASKAPLKTEQPVKPPREEANFGKFSDGVYEGQAQGYKDLLTVSLVIKDGKIVSLKQINGGDDEPYISNARTILTQVLAKQTTKGVDVYSGATYSSLGLLNATNRALKKASGSSSNESNADVSDYKLKIKKLNEEVENLKSRIIKKALDDGEGTLKDGNYEGSAIGYNGPVVMNVKVETGKIVDVSIKSHTDDKDYVEKVIPLLATIIKNQGTKNVDTISGATFSSNGVLGGASNAIRLARGLKPKEVGENAEQIKRLNADIERLKAQLKSPDGSDVTGTLKDGDYIGKASGYGGLMEVYVTIKEGKVTSVLLSKNNEDAEYLDKASSILNEIIKLGTTKGVDTVSGATFSSNGILNAVRNAMAKASGQDTKDDSQVELVSKDKLTALEDEVATLKEKIEVFNKKNAKNASEKADGEYTGFGTGYANRLIKAFVTIKDKKITAIRLEHNEDRGQYLSEEREKTILNNIIEKNGTVGVDTISGATLSSGGIIQAVNDALGGGESSSGGLLDSLNKVIASLKEALSDIFTDKKAFLWEVEEKEASIPLADGVYTGYGRGWSKVRDGYTDEELSEKGNPAPYNLVTSIVTIENGKIVDIETTEPSSKKSKPYLSSAMEVQDRIISQGSILNVDTESGATYTSRGILEAVSMALQKSRAVSQAKNVSETPSSASVVQGTDKQLEEASLALERLKTENDKLMKELETYKNNVSEE